MRKFFPLLLAALLLAAAARAQTPESSPTPEPTPANSLSKEERKKLDELRKFMRKENERAEKERMKRPAEIQIRAKAENIRPFIIAAMQEQGYFLRDDSAVRLVFTRQETGWRAAMAKAGNPNSGPPAYEVAFVTSEVDGVTTVIVDMSYSIQNAFGRVDRRDLNRDKGSRRNLEAILNTIKARAEN